MGSSSKAIQLATSTTLSTLVWTSREFSITGGRLSRTGLPMGLGQRTFSRDAEVAAACRRLSPPAAAAIMELVAVCKNCLRPRGPKFILEHELDACLEREGSATGSDLCDRAEAVYSDLGHGGGGERRASESDWTGHRASEASAGCWRIR